MADVISNKQLYLKILKKRFFFKFALIKTISSLVKSLQNFKLNLFSCKNMQKKFVKNTFGWITHNEKFYF